MFIFGFIKSKTPVFQTSATAHYRSPTPALKSGQYKAKTAQKSGYKAIISNGRLRVNMKINVERVIVLISLITSGTAITTT